MGAVSAAAVTPGVEPEPAAVVFDRVSFGFDDHVVLRDISFRVDAGGMTILPGASGSGKSALLKLKQILFMTLPPR
ncbi:MAG: hypothetical protein ACRD2I_19290 [Vicinamibacterales bacterium]